MKLADGRVKDGEFRNNKFMGSSRKPTKLGGIQEENEDHADGKAVN